MSSTNTCSTSTVIVEPLIRRSPITLRFPVIVPPLRESFLSMDDASDVTALVLVDISLDTIVEREVVFESTVETIVESEVTLLFVVDISDSSSRWVLVPIFVSKKWSDATYVPELASELDAL